VGLRELRWHDGLFVLATLASLLLAPWVSHDTAPDALGVALALVMGAAVAVRRVWPLLTLATVLVAGTVWVVTDHGEVAVGVVMMLALATVGNRCPPLVSVPLTLGVLVVVYVTAALSHNVPRFDESNFQLLGWLVAAAGGGLVVRSRRVELAAVLAREEDLREQEAESRVDQERLRIAQELHDTVGHTVATVTIQAEVAARVLDDHPEQARTALETIAEVSRTTLQEIRATLGMLRSGDGEAAAAEKAPVPSVADIARVLDVLRGRGLTVDFDRRGHAPVPASLGGVLYRIVQEAATNILKHAEGVTHVWVTLECDPAALVLGVLDDGAPLAGPVVEPPGHHGLAGMKERARALGGWVTTEARPEGGFEVRAVFPTGGRT
jgi:signal transduction histidine kinase